MSLKILTLSSYNELPENLGNIEGLGELDVSGTYISFYLILKNKIFISNTLSFSF